MSDRGRRIYITGASGAGVSTLGGAIADALVAPFFDVDDYYWLSTDPPFRTKRPPEQRLQMLKMDLAGERWVLAGSLDGWGDAIVEIATRVIYVDTDTTTRVARIRARELQRFGERVRPGGDMFEQHEAFVTWAAAYEDGTVAGRSRHRHETWLSQVRIPVLRLDGGQDVGALLRKALAETAG
jgi:adenylate kinase family enzyme